MEYGTPLLVDSEDGMLTTWDEYAGEMDQTMVKTRQSGWVETHLVQVPLSHLEGRHMDAAGHYAAVKKLTGR